MQKGLSLRSFLAEGGQTQVLILAGIVILIAVAGGIFFLGRMTTPKPQPSPLSTEAPAKVEDPTANWKTSISKGGEFSFKYPPSWYPEDNPGYPGGNNVGFFLVGTKADHGYGDHKGNEVFTFELSDDNRSLADLKNNYYKDATELTISGKPALRTSFNLFIIKPSQTKVLNIVGGTEEARKYIDQILSTFRFD